jgi:rubrerythrin
MKTHDFMLLGLCALLATAQAQPQSASPETAGNLQAAYKGEAQAASFYTACAQQAMREGYPDAAKLFRAAAFSEAIHRDNHRRALRTVGVMQDKLPYTRTKVKSTRDNLAESVADEQQESRVMYPDYIRTARRQGIPGAERAFRCARDSERSHARLLESTLNRLGWKPATDYFVCQTCGMTTLDAGPAVCSVCRGSGMNYKKVE